MQAFIPVSVCPNEAVQAVALVAAEAAATTVTNPPLSVPDIVQLPPEGGVAPVPVSHAIVGAVVPAF